MKNLFLLLFSFVLLLPISIEAEVLVTEGRKAIILIAKIPDKPIVKSAPVVSQQFTVELIDDAEIAITAATAIADVTVSLYKDGLLVDAYVFSFDANDTKTILLDDYTVGEYVIELTLPSGVYLQGSFTL
ncbi:DUF3244 domain-containing protein [Bacteroides sp. 214]|uniref:DUF3244 domain-containing protein n=1 Tax=Bacteroides sp. 214 TaxID=2302935 RepID=UPI0013CFA65F|nr:DUF3244 domain-containing protein [Bacteroides sp. 214]NDW12079.1 DUF3244 domain-containing protein [Bacteroides sp. 214]